MAKTVGVTRFHALTEFWRLSSEFRQQGLPPPVAATLTRRPSAALVAIKQELVESHLDVRLDSRGVVVSLPQALPFAPGEDRINGDALATVSAIGDVLSKIPNNVTLVGHTDADPIHNRRFANNWELAAARGLRLLELLSSRY
jgi:flagellar motor protein MotB